MTAAGMVAVIFFLLATLPSRPRVASWTGSPEIARRTVAAAYHVHTTRSDGAGDRATVAAAAARAGLTVVIFTDHGDGTRAPDAPAYIDGVLCIDGVEISSAGGHYVALGTAAAPYPLGGEPSAVVEDVRRLGGFGFAAHPDSARPQLAWADWDAPFDGLEWLSADTEWRNESRVRLTRVLFDYMLRPGPALASILDRPASTLSRWDALASHRPVVGIAGHDAHGGIGKTTQEGQRFAIAGVPSYESSFRSFSVRIVLDRPFGGSADVDAAAVLNALRRGSVFTAIDGVAQRAVLDFHAVRAAGITAMGSMLDPGPVTFVVEAAVPSGARTILLRDGEEVQSVSGGALRLDQAEGRGAYRVEIHVPGAPGIPPVPWLVSNPIYLLPRVETAAAVERAAATPLAPDVRWHVEKDPASAATLAASPAEVKAEYTLAGGARASQFVALVADLQGRPSDFRSIRFNAAAAKPARVSVQLRYASGGGERWRRSVYVDSTPRDFAIDLSEMLPADNQTGRAPGSASATALLFVVDLTNTKPGDSNAIRLTGVGVSR